MRGLVDFVQYFYEVKDLSLKMQQTKGLYHYSFGNDDFSKILHIKVVFFFEIPY